MILHARSIDGYMSIYCLNAVEGCTVAGCVCYCHITDKSTEPGPTPEVGSVVFDASADTLSTYNSESINKTDEELRFGPNDIKILAIDPGVTHGFAYHNLFTSEEVYWQDASTHLEFTRILITRRPDIIVCESFEHEHRDNVVYAPVEFIGLVKWYVESENIKLAMQTPSYGKGYFDNSKLRKLGIYRPGKSYNHAMDAARHMHQFLMRHDKFDLTRLK